MRMSWDAACGQNVLVFDDEDIAQFAKECDQLIYGIKKGEEIMKKDYRDVIRVWNDGTSIPYDYYSAGLAQIDYRINGYKVWIDTSEWDGNVAGIMRAIYDSCGYMENHLYHKVKANVEMIKRTRQHKVHVYPIESTPLVPNVIKNVIFQEPATIVYWADGSKTVVICQEGDIYDEEKGLAMAISKKALGNNWAAGGRFKKAFKNAIRRK